MTEYTPAFGHRAIKVSQREIKSCGYCYQRKVKCDRPFPCSRCRQRGLAEFCEQQAALVNGRVRGGRSSSPRPRSSDHNHLAASSSADVASGEISAGGARRRGRPATIDELQAENKVLLRKLAAQEKALHNLIREQAQANNPLQNGQDRHPEQRQRLPRRTSFSLPTVGAPEGDNMYRYTGPRASLAALDPSSDPDPDPDPERETNETEAKLDYLSTVRQVFGMQSDGAGPAAAQEPKLIFTEPSTTTLEAMHMVVPVVYTEFLVRFHCNFLHWIHGVFHIPSFLAQHHEWISALLAVMPAAAGNSAPAGSSTESGAAVGMTSKSRQSYDFLALYFAIISCGLYFLDEPTASKHGLTKEEIDVLPRFWFDISINCLQLSGFMVRPTYPVLQAICILPMVAHAFGASKYIRSLMHCATGLAQELDLHLLTPEYERAKFLRSQALDTVHAELGRRIWWCLKIAESFNPGSGHLTHLIYPAAATSSPANADDSDIINGSSVVSKPFDQMTGITYLLFMGVRADIHREFIYDLAKQKTLSGRHRCAKEYDRKFTQVLHAFPSLDLHADEPYPDSSELNPYMPFDYRPWVRFINSTSAPYCRIILYQQFLVRSYRDDRFLEERSLCLEAARAIMAARRKPAPLIFQKNWHISSETIIAAMTLTLDLMHGQHDESTKVALRAEVHEAIAILQRGNLANVMIPRGIAVLQRMLAEEISDRTVTVPASHAQHFQYPLRDTRGWQESTSTHANEIGTVANPNPFPPGGFSSELGSGPALGLGLDSQYRPQSHSGQADRSTSTATIGTGSLDLVDLGDDFFDALLQMDTTSFAM